MASVITAREPRHRVGTNCQQLRTAPLRIHQLSIDQCWEATMCCLMDVDVGCAIASEAEKGRQLACYRKEASVCTFCV